MSDPSAADAASPDAYRFGDFELCLPRRELRRGGQPVALQPKVFDFIAYLLLHRERVVDKNELLDAVWPKQVVTEAALTRCVMKARRALDDDAENPRVILTVHGRGYRFMAPVVPIVERRTVPREPLPAPAATADAPPAAGPALSAGAAPPGPDRRAPGRPASTPASRLPWRALAALALLGLAMAMYFGWRGQEADRRALVAGGPVRLAILPVLNATGEERYDWARYNEGVLEMDLWRALILSQRGQHAQARTLARTVLSAAEGGRLPPLQVGAHTVLACIEGAEGRHEVALAQWERALAVLDAELPGERLGRVELPLAVHRLRRPGAALPAAPRRADHAGADRAHRRRVGAAAGCG